CCSLTIQIICDLCSFTYIHESYYSINCSILKSLPNTTPCRHFRSLLLAVLFAPSLDTMLAIPNTLLAFGAMSGIILSALAVPMPEEPVVPSDPNANSTVILPRDSYTCYGGATALKYSFYSQAAIICERLARVKQPLGGWYDYSIDYDGSVIKNRFFNNNPNPFYLTEDLCKARFREIIDGCDYQFDLKHGGDHTYADGTFFATWAAR
ncbi:hypothetical protein DM02DRAFT_701632, partial [Periconia macrospinosa]